MLRDNFPSTIDMRDLKVKQDRGVLNAESAAGAALNDQIASLQAQIGQNKRILTRSNRKLPISRQSKRGSMHNVLSFK
jgi:hypothetical protein